MSINVVIRRTKLVFTNIQSIISWACKKLQWNSVILYLNPKLSNLLTVPLLPQSSWSVSSYVQHSYRFSNFVIWILESNECVYYDNTYWNNQTINSIRIPRNKSLFFHKGFFLLLFGAWLHALQDQMIQNFYFTSSNHHSLIRFGISLTYDWYLGFVINEESLLNWTPSFLYFSLNNNLNFLNVRVAVQVVSFLRLSAALS